MADDKMHSRMMQAIANMSKDMRTPMSAILCMLDLLQDAELTSEQREQVGMASRSARLLQSTLGDIVDASWIEAGLLKLEEKPFDLKETLEDTAQLVASQMLAPELDFAVEYPFSAPRWLSGDGPRVRQVVMNLLRNVAEAAQSDHVLLKVEYQGSENGRSAFCIHITDTDTGVPASTALHPVSAGTGTRIVSAEDLHLAISRELVTMMGGRILATSRDGIDCAYAFTFRQPAVENLESALRRPDSSSPIRVLVVDNNLTSRRVLADRLRHWGGKGEAFTEIVPALEALRAAKEPFDVMFLNYPMPGLDARTLRETWQGLRQKPRLLLMCRAQPQEESPESILGIEGAVSVVKPVRESQMLDVLYPAPVEAAVSPKAKPVSAGAGADRFRALLVEDSPIIRKVAVAILEKIGCHVDTAVNGQEGLSAALQTTYDVIFMDCEMPVMDGFEATREIRRAEQGRRTPILAMTSFSSQKDREACLSCGMDEVVPKPIDKEVLLAVLDKYLSGVSTAAAGEPMRLLLVEDDRSLRTLMHMNLRKQFPKAEIRVANNGMEACALVGSFLPKVIVTDVMMPEMDAVSMVRFLKSKKRYSATRLVVVTALGSSDSRVQELRKLGVDSILHKPFRMPELLRVTCDAMGVPFDPEAADAQDGKRLQVWNRARAMRTLDNDEDLLREVVAAYLEDGKEDIRSFDLAAQRRDGPLLGKVAHKIKGTAVGLGAEFLFHAAADVEDAVREDTVVDFDKATQTIRREFDRLCQALEQDVTASS